MSKATDYLHQLTWLRGFAAFIVVISHTIRATEVAYTGNEDVRVFALASAFDLGSFGVVLFFTLSGTTLFVSSKGQLSSVFNFYAKRFFRIWPAFMVSLTAYIAFAWVFKAFYTEPQGHWIEFQFLADYTLYDLLSYVTLTVNINGTEGLFNNAFWSLPVEFQYYLIFPLLLLSLRFIGILGPVLIGGALYAIYRYDLVAMSSSSVFNVGYSFCGGVLLGHLYKSFKHRLSANAGLAVLLVSFAVISLMAATIVPLPDFPIVSNIWNWYVVFSFVFVGMCLFCKFTLPEKLQDWLEVYGSISYSTYLYHNLVIAFLVLLLIHLDINNGLLRYLFVLLGTLGLTYPIALYSYKLIELPSIGYGRKITGSLRSKPASVS